MLEKEINPLKRGRIPGKANKQKKKSLVGEITDPSSVLNDSIAIKNQQEGPKDCHDALSHERNEMIASCRNRDVSPNEEEDYIPSEGKHRLKTTTVDVLDPSKATVGDPIQKVPRTQRDDHCHRPPKTNAFLHCRNDSSHEKSELCSDFQQKLPPSANHSGTHHCSCDEEKKYSVKNFLRKIWKFLGFNASCPSSHRPSASASVSEDKPITHTPFNHRQYKSNFKNCGTHGVKRNYRNGRRRSMPPQSNF
ncbi:MAG: hypothetical protein LBB11_03310 [Puniceicoccales bacterium]|jgi:hypothetical protein|nr:hypothetical protein [Puniceicoccales bacterium]